MYKYYTYANSKYTVPKKIVYRQYITVYNSYKRVNGIDNVFQFKMPTIPKLFIFFNEFLCIWDISMCA